MLDAAVPATSDVEPLPRTPLSLGCQRLAVFLAFEETLERNRLRAAVRKGEATERTQDRRQKYYPRVALRRPVAFEFVFHGLKNQPIL